MAKTILIADDDATVVNLFHLDAEGRNSDITIRSSENGLDAIRIIEESKPDLVILDIRMPKADGFAVLEHLQKNQLDIPVLILTNYKNAEYVQKSKSYSNVRDYIVKHEVSMNQVLKAVGAHL